MSCKRKGSSRRIRQSSVRISGMYGERTREMQSRLTEELFKLTFKVANVYQYLGSAESNEPSVDDIQTKVFYEVQDRKYEDNPIPIHIGMEPVTESPMDFARFGILNPLSNEITIRVHVNEFHNCLGRWLRVGDVLEIPFLMRDCEKAFFEVNDVDDKPSYERFYVTARIAPLKDSRKTFDIDKGGRSNHDFNISIQEQQDIEFEDMVPYEGIGKELEEEIPMDSRRKKQRNFLDDPSATFDPEE